MPTIHEQPYAPYLRWHKTHRRVRFELTGSGAAPVDPADFFGPARAVRVDVGGPYGHPRMIEGIARLYGVSPDRVLPVPGTSCANFVALAVAASRGDTVLIEQPVYDPFVRAATFLDLQIRPILRSAVNDFAVVAASLQSALEHHRARAVVITNLHNPGGRRLTRAELQVLADCCADQNVCLIVDEVYLDAAHICLGEPRWTAAALGDNVLVTSSLTKVYGLGGLRAGWLLAWPKHMEKARDLVDLLHADFPAPAADLAVFALSNLEALEKRYQTQYEAGRAVFTRWLESEPRVGVYPNHGALFECVRLPHGIHSVDFNARLAADAATQVVPGRFFGLDDHIRIGLAVPRDDLAEGLRNISRTLDGMLP